MKNVINYYYNLFPNEIHQKNKKFYFEIEKVKFVFFVYSKDFSKTQSIEKMIHILDAGNIKYNQIVKNTSGIIITYVNNNPYILLKLNEQSEDIVIFKDIIDFNKRMSGLFNEKLNIESLLRLWMDKIDYFEYQVSQFGIKFPIIRNSFNYFIGYAENAVILLKNLIYANIGIMISHHRITNNMILQELYNPLDFVLDSSVRDISEYLKEKLFFTDNIDIVEYYFKYSNITNNEAIMFFSRLLYPTYYFDICENIIDGDNDTLLKTVLQRITVYEKNIRLIYIFLKKQYNIPEIEWLLINQD
ncbi:MAG: hypothetical protein RRY16_00860 [Bacilli bacterium]